MMDQPSMLELIEAVKQFIETKAIPELKGHTAFHARVASNALGIVVRELQSGGKAANEEKARLVELIGSDGTLEELNHVLCTQIREGRIGLDTPGLAEHLEKTTRAKVVIDQPGYSGLKQTP